MDQLRRIYIYFFLCVCVLRWEFMSTDDAGCPTRCLARCATVSLQHPIKNETKKQDGAVGVLCCSVPTQGRVGWRDIQSFAIRPHTTATSDPSHWTLKNKGSACSIVAFCSKCVESVALNKIFCKRTGVFTLSFTHTLSSIQLLWSITKTMIILQQHNNGTILVPDEKTLLCVPLFLSTKATLS